MGRKAAPPPPPPPLPPPSRRAALHNAIHEAYLGPQFAEWSLDSDSTIEMPNPGSAPWGLESISPIFRVHQKSTWRRHIEFLWNFLRTDFQVSANTSCGRHVHLSRAGVYSLGGLKRVCQSIIHFEPAFEALLPEDQLSNEYARSNWLDSANFGHRNLSRRQSMAAIQNAASMRDLVLFMNPNQDKTFGWNFLYLLNSPNGTIEFRRGAACTSAQQVFVYIEIVMSFIEAAIQLSTVENLERVPSTVGLLKRSIQAANFPNNVPGLYDSRYLSLCFGNKSDNTFREPKPLGRLSAYQLNKLKKKKEDDKKKNMAMVKMMREPYWG
ncbi:putative amidoligase enzyme-domain-containing protein [Aspergillus venezuelensis]